MQASEVTLGRVRGDAWPRPVPASVEIQPILTSAPLATLAIVPRPPLLQSEQRVETPDEFVTSWEARSQNAITESRSGPKTQVRHTCRKQQ
jgi:hypothetical protein